MERLRRHEPVMVAEVLTHLMPQRGGLFVDCTVGCGGHAAALLESGAGRVIGLDRDTDALKLAQESLGRWSGQIELVHADYRQLPSVLEARGVGLIDGALADLGVSSVQLDADGRGFSFRRDEPLDMRMDRTCGQTASELLRDVSESTLADVIYRYGEERHSRRVARAIVETRVSRPIVSTGQLASIVRRAIPRPSHERIDPATRTFQALRIWVNRELDGLDAFLHDLSRRLRAGARVVVITFHSLEDRIVKHTLRALESGAEATLRVLTRKPIRAGDAELARNPRARSAKLRAAERLV